MEATIYTADGQITRTNLNTFQDIKNILGAYVEVVNINGTEVAVDDEGLLKGLAPNSAFPGLVGTVVSLPKEWDTLPYE